MRESCSSGSVGGEGGNRLAYPACGSGFASAVTSCWNLLSCAISLRCCSEQERNVHASAEVSGCFGCFSRAGGPIGNAV